MSCSLSAKTEICDQICGVGAINGRCMLRKREKDEDEKSMVTKYATCTPDVTTCPDGVCDELEAQHPDICPQDCTSKHIASFISYLKFGSLP